MISVACREFGGWPSDALREDMGIVERVLEYRAAEQAVELMNEGGDGAKRLGENAYQMAILRDMMRAQGQSVGVGSLAALVAAAAAKQEQDDDG